MTGAVAAMAGVGGRDVTPNPLNWANIVSVLSGGSNADQAITGINQTITLHLDLTITQGVGTLNYVKNGGDDVAFVDNGTVSIANNDTLHFHAVRSGGDEFSGTVSIKNASDGMLELDSFTFDLVII